MRKAIAAMILSMLLPVGPVFAVKLASLYEVKIPVLSQQPEDRAAAVREGFLQVLIKLSGNPAIEKNPAIKAALKRSDYYVQEYSYEAPMNSESNYTIRIRFEKTDMSRLLKKSSVAFWGEKRPLILVWLVTTNIDEDYQIIGNEESSTMLEIFKREGRKYGLPLIFPMMDVADLDQVTADDVARMNLAVLNAAGKRYSPDVLLIGKVIDNKSELTSRWVLVSKGSSWEFTISNVNADLLFADILNQVRQTLTNQQVAVNEAAQQQMVAKQQMAAKQEVIATAQDEMPNKLIEDLKEDLKN